MAGEHGAYSSSLMIIILIKVHILYVQVPKRRRTDPRLASITPTRPYHRTRSRKGRLGARLREDKSITGSKTGDVRRARYGRSLDDPEGTVLGKGIRRGGPNAQCR
jgi:hypothetical protein